MFTKSQEMENIEQIGENATNANICNANVAEVSAVCEDANKAVGVIIAELLDSSSDSDDDDFYFLAGKKFECTVDLLLELENALPKKKRHSIPYYLQEIVPKYSEEEFVQHFRISKSLYSSLSKKFEESIIYKNLRPDKRLLATTYVAIFLWFAGHEACSFHDLSDRFNVSISSVSRIITKTTMFFSSMSPEVIKWPTEERKQETANFFRNKCGFSKAIGRIDATHIVIDPPSRRKDDYIDRKGNITLCLQAVCDEKKNL